jgi:tetratricopeptide (TPR) repeat protein
MSEFLGDGFHALLRELVQRVKAVQRGQEKSRFILLEAPSGSGKSRVVRELYAAMRVDPAFQKHSKSNAFYWPALDADNYIADGLNSGFKERKVLGPDPMTFQNVDGALPGFLWIPIRCDILSGTAGSSAIDLMLPHLRRHSPYVALSWRRAANPKENLAGWFADNFRKEIDVILDNASVEVVLKIFEITLDVAFPMLAYAIDKAFGVGKKMAKRVLPSKNKERLSPNFDKDPSATFSKLVRMVHKDVPLVIVLEDAHLIDEPTAQLIRQLIASGADKPIFIIATAWPESRNRGIFEKLTRDLSDAGQLETFGGLGHFGFPELGHLERTSIVYEVAPLTQPQIAELIAEIWKNPLALKLNLGSERVQRSIRDGAITASPEELRKIPRDVRRIYEQRWLELEPDLKQVLMLLSGSIPTNRHLDGAITPVIAKVVASAVAKSGLGSSDQDEFRELVDKAISPVRWIVGNDQSELELQFREVILQIIAINQFEDHFTTLEMERFRCFLVNEIAIWILQREDSWFDIDEPVGVQVSRWLLDLTPSSETRSLVISATAIAALSVANFEGYYWNVKESVEILQSSAIVGLTTPASKLRAHLVLGMSLGRLGKTSEAMESFDMAESVLLAEFEDQDDLTENLYWIVSNRAHFLADRGRFDEALTSLYSLLNRIRRIPGQGEQNVLEQEVRILNAIAELHMVAEDNQAAFEISEETMELLPSIANPLSYWKLIPQVTHARLLYEFNDFSNSIPIIEWLLWSVENANEPLPDDLERQVYMTAGLVYYGFGDHKTSERLLNTAFEQSVAAGGINSDFARTAKMYLAWMKTGAELPEQIRMLTEIVDQEQALMGTGHPRLLSALGNLAIAYSELAGGEQMAFDLAIRVRDLARECMPEGDAELIHAEREAILLEPNRVPSHTSAEQILGLYKSFREGHDPAHRQAQACLVIAAREYRSIGEFKIAEETLLEGMQDLLASKKNQHNFSWRLRLELAQIQFESEARDTALASLESLIDESLELDGHQSSTFQHAVITKAEMLKEMGRELEAESFPQLFDMLATWNLTHPEDAREWRISMGI